MRETHKRLRAFLRAYLSGLLVWRVISRCDKNIFKTVRLLDRLKTSRGLSIPNGSGYNRFSIARSIYYLSPWMWGHRCLYESLLYYLHCPSKRPDKPEVNIGLRIDYGRTKLGHCWISVGGVPVNGRDADFAAYYAEPFSHKYNVYYWLPASPGGIKKMALLGVKSPVPTPMLLKERQDDR